ncbi:hypothetical protein AAG570_010487 [Ranatra chinensis]|uniref:Uncharacterized protein n=1 Tax=Ranatra chinensis TaxID=642074 RepID=A0ABD0Z0T5_9HEMI
MSITRATVLLYTDYRQHLPSAHVSVVGFGFSNRTIGTGLKCCSSRGVKPHQSSGINTIGRIKVSTWNYPHHVAPPYVTSTRRLEKVASAQEMEVRTQLEESDSDPSDGLTWWRFQQRLEGAGEVSDVIYHVKRDPATKKNRLRMYLPALNRGVLDGVVFRMSDYHAKGPGFD